MTGAPGSANRNEEGATGLARLKVERERRGLERQQVADELHVDAWIIEALEAGQFERLGAAVYALGHLRKYAELLGLDSEQLLASFGQIDREPPPLVPTVPARQPRHEVPVTLVSALVVGVVVIGTAWWALTERKAVAPSIPTSAPTQEPAAAMAEATVVEAPTVPATTEDTAPIVAPAVPPPAEPTRPESAAESASAGTPVRLRLSFSSDSWVELYDAAGQRIFFDLGPANSVRSFSTTAPVRVFLGNAEGVQLELNGQSVALPEQVIRGNVARFTVDAQGRVRMAEG